MKNNSRVYFLISFLGLFLGGSLHTGATLNCWQDLRGSVRRLASLSVSNSQKPVDAIQKIAEPILLENIASAETKITLAKLIKHGKQYKKISLSAPEIGLDKQIILLFRTSEPIILINPQLQFRSRMFAVRVEGEWVFENAKVVSLDYTNIEGKIQTLFLKDQEIEHVLLSYKKIQGTADFKRVLKNWGFALPDNHSSRTLDEFYTLYGKSSSWKKYFNTLFHNLLDVTDPYARTFSLVEGFAHERKIDKVLSWYRIFFEDASAIEKKISDWITDSDHAGFAYDWLFKEEPHLLKTILPYLKENNPFFKDVVLNASSDGQSLVTLAFELEGSNPAMTLLYKEPTLSDHEWSQLSENYRIKYLSKIVSNNQKEFMEADKIAPTALKPKYLKGFSDDYEMVGGPETPQFTWEVAHKNYEISPPILLAEVEEMSQIFKQTHSFHIHIVFDFIDSVINGNTEFEQFINWFKHINDFLYLRGMEEGLHGNSRTEIVKLKKPGFFRKLFPLAEMEPGFFPRSPSEIMSENYKFFSMGLRRSIYGEGLFGGKFAKIGLELRDVTRNLETLKVYIQNIVQMVGQKAWHKISLAEFKKIKPLSLENISDDSFNYLSSKFKNKILKLEPMVKLPYFKFEECLVLKGDLSSSKLGSEKINDEVLTRIQKSREYFKDEMLKLEKEWLEIKEKKEEVEDDLLKMAAQLNLSMWAEMAKPSEIYRWP